jgi:putative SOS response-associated peptidase YedK
MRRFPRLGLIPTWAKDAAIGNRMINAGAETLTAKPTFRGAFRKRRCLIIADGFYEWQKQDSGPIAELGGRFADLTKNSLFRDLSSLFGRKISLFRCVGNSAK